MSEVPYVLPMDEQRDVIKKIIDWFNDQMSGRYDGCLPDSYMTLDCETTGFSHRDLIVEMGHCVVEEGVGQYYESTILNWADHPDISEGFLRNQFARQKRDGYNQHVTIKKMREVGQRPEDVLETYLEVFEKNREDDQIFAGHNFVGFDRPRIMKHMEWWIGAEWIFYYDDPDFENECFDTSIVEKACQVGLIPFADETPRKYFGRVVGNKQKGVRFKLGPHCVPKYGLDVKYDLDPDKEHSAGYDAMLVHLLLEEYANIAGCREVE